MSSRIESLVKTVVEAWVKCRAWYGADSDLGRALDELARWQFDESVCESEHPAALLEIEKTAERMANAKSAQSAVEKPEEWIDCGAIDISGQPIFGEMAYVRHDKQPQPVTPPQPRDESRDIWIERYNGSGYERYVPYSQLEAERRGKLDVIAKVKAVVDAFEGCDNEPFDCHSLPDAVYALKSVIEAHEARNEPSDSELLDAILDAYLTAGVDGFGDTLERAIAERAKI